MAGRDVLAEIEALVGKADAESLLGQARRWEAKAEQLEAEAQRHRLKAQKYRAQAAEVA